jgi:hypothetical protein
MKKLDPVGVISPGFNAGVSRRICACAVDRNNTSAPVAAPAVRHFRRFDIARHSYEPGLDVSRSGVALADSLAAGGKDAISIPAEWPFLCAHLSLRRHPKQANTRRRQQFRLRRCRLQQDGVWKRTGSSV